MISPFAVCNAGCDQGLIANKKMPLGRVAFFVSIDINPLRNFRYATLQLDMCFTLDMRCGARGIYIISHCKATYRKKHRAVHCLLWKPLAFVWGYAIMETLKI